MAEPRLQHNWEAEYEKSDDKQRTKKKIPAEFADVVDPLDRLEPEQLIGQENFFVYEEANANYDPSVQPYSYFYLNITGQIDAGHFLEEDGLAVKYAFVQGDDWQVASGQTEGHSQFSFKSSNSMVAAKKIVWNMPFEINYRSMNPFGWP